ncbi:MAG: PAS domain S-box protein [Nannocystaceae bacterium]
MSADTEVGIGQLDGDGRWVRVNRRLGELLGLAPRELCGRDFTSCFTRAPIDGDALDALIRGEREAYVVDLDLRRDGATRRLRVNLSAIDGCEPEAPELFAVVADVSAERAAETSARVMAQIAERTSAVVLLCDESFAIEWVNDSFSAVFGYTFEECVGRRPWELSVARGGGVERFAAQAKLAGGGRQVVPRYTKDGRRVMLDLEIRPFADPLTGATYMMGIGHDITARVAAEAALRRSEVRLRAIGDQLPDAVLFEMSIAADGRRQVEYVSAGVERMRGVTAAEVYADIGVLARQLDPADAARVAAVRDATPSGEPVYLEFPITTVAGERRWVSLVALVEREASGAQIWRGIETDITARKRLAEDLAAAKEAAEAANNAKSMFLANVSHEIRTPLGGIVGMVEILLDEPLAPVHAERLRIVQRSANWLMELVDDLLDISRIEAGKLTIDPHPFDLHAEISQVLCAFGARAHVKGIELTCDVHPEVPRRVIGDVVRFRQVLVNLVSNAIKFTDEGGVSVTVREAESEAASDLDLDRSGEVIRVAVGVIDTGIGIPAARLREIFAPFEQADRTTTRRFGGSGLGLAICARLVEMMRGSIRVLSEPGVGSAFWFDVEFIVDPSVEALAEPARAELASVIPRALVIDSGPLAGELFARLCERWRIDAEVVCDLEGARAALDRAMICGPALDLIIVDPEGLSADIDEVLAETRGRGYRGPAVLATAEDLPSHLREDPEIAVVRKPFTPSELRGALDQLFALRPRPQVERREEGLGLAGVEPLRVLLAEDEEVNRLVAVDMLSRAGHEVTAVSDGAEAIEAARAGAFDVVLMDLEMPRVDGRVAARRIREAERGGARLPIVALTAHTRPGESEGSLAAGMDGHITKPLQTRELVRVLLEIGVATPRRQPAEERRPHEPPAIVDREAVLERLGGDRRLLRRIIELFRENAPSLVRELEEAVARGDARRVKHDAHRLAGMLSNFNAAAAQGLARQLEERARAGSLDGGAELLVALRERLARLERDLDGLARDEPVERQARARSG